MWYFLIRLMCFIVTRSWCPYCSWWNIFSNSKWSCTRTKWLFIMIILSRIWSLLLLLPFISKWFFSRWIWTYYFSIWWFLTYKIKSMSWIISPWAWTPFRRSWILYIWWKIMNTKMFFSHCYIFSSCTKRKFIANILSRCTCWCITNSQLFSIFNKS